MTQISNTLAPLPVTLPRPDGFDQSSSMWIDEAIWGHRLYDEQLPWFIFLEFLNVFYHENDKGRAFEEVEGLNTIKYRAAHRLYLRNILFNNPHLDEIRMKFPCDINRWDEWLRRMKNAAGIPQAHFGYIKDHFNSFDDFCEVVSLVRSNSFEVNSNKRWTSKFVFPFGRDCLYEDLDHDTRSNDRRFFARTGEVLYLMLCRAKNKRMLLAVLNDRLSHSDPTWNAIVKCLQPADDDEMSGDHANAFLPYSEHKCFDDIADDWLAVLNLKLPQYDVFPHLVTLAGLHMMKYQLTVARQYLNATVPPVFICEMVAPRKSLVREVSCDQYQANNNLPAQAVDAFIINIEKSAEWQAALSQPGSDERCKHILHEKVSWEYDGPPFVTDMLPRLQQEAIKRHRQHIANIHRNYGRDIGLVSKRGTVKLRYAPTDALLRTLIFANVEKRVELHQFLDRLYERYGVVIGDKEAERVLNKGEYDKKQFQNNLRRLEQRLMSLGLLRRLSDGCAYVENPYRVVTI